jgi:hypothetical protein
MTCVIAEVFRTLIQFALSSIITGTIEHMAFIRRRDCNPRHWPKCKTNSLSQLDKAATQSEADAAVDVRN